MSGRHPVEGQTAVCAAPNINARVERSMFASIDRQRLSGIAARTVAGFRRGGMGSYRLGSQADARVQRPIIAEAASSGWKIPNATWLYVEGRRDSFPGFAHCDGDRWYQARATDVHANGLANAKNGLPNMQWELLYSLAQGHGLMTWSSPGARRENRKHREALNKTLRAFFGIDGDPIGLTDDKKGYRCTFKLVPDNSLEYARLAADREDE